MFEAQILSNQNLTWADEVRPKGKSSGSRLQSGSASANCGTVHHLPIGLETRAVTRAVPRALDRIPLYGATEVSAEGLSLVQHATFIAVHRHLGHAAAVNGALSGFELRCVVDFARRDDVRVLRGDIEILFCEFLECAKGRHPGIARAPTAAAVLARL